MPGARSTPASQSALDLKAAPASPVPQPRSSMEPNRGARPLARQAASTAGKQQRGATIGEVCKRLVEARGILVEQCADIGWRHGVARFPGVEPGQPEPRSQAIFRVGVARLAECRNSAQAILKPLAYVAEHEPCAGEAGRDFERLSEQIGGGGQVAARQKLARHVITLIGEDIARRKNRAGGADIGGSC